MSNTLSVGKLIEELSKYPLDLPVYIDCCREIERVYINNEHYFGDSCNPDCRVGSAVEIE